MDLAGVRYSNAAPDCAAELLATSAGPASSGSGRRDRASRSSCRRSGSPASRPRCARSRGLDRYPGCVVGVGRPGVAQPVRRRSSVDEVFDRLTHAITGVGIQRDQRRERCRSSETHVASSGGRSRFVPETRRTPRTLATTLRQPHAKVPSVNEKAANQYTHGHHESVLRSHRWRTAENSAAYLLGSLRPGLRSPRRRLRTRQHHDRPREPREPGTTVGIDAAATIVDAADRGDGRASPASSSRSPTSTTCRSPTARSTSSTRIRCCNTWPIRSRRCGRCAGSAGPAVSSPRATATTRRSPGIRREPGSRAGSTCTARSRAATAASPTPVAGSCAGPTKPASPT